MSKTFITKNCTVWGLLSGLSLIPLLLIGLTLGVKNYLFDISFLIHALLLLIALANSLRLLFRCSSWVCLLGLPFLAFILFMGSFPITARDALIHHLAVPKWWLEADKIFQIPWHEWSYYPMLLDLGFLGLLKHGFEALTPYYHAVFLLLVSVQVAAYVFEETENKVAAAFGFLFVLSLPICLKLATTPLVDLGLAFFASIAVFEMARWIKTEDSFHMKASGIALGLALGTKYNGLLLSFVIVAFAFPYIFKKKNFKSSDVLWFLGLTLLVALPWFAKNVAWTGNPIYPLYRSIFGPEVVSLPGPKGLSPIAQRLIQYNESFLQLALLPIRMFFFGKDDEPQFFDGVLSPILLLSFVPLFLGLNRKWISYVSLVCIAYFLLALLLSGARVRYMSPLFGPMAALAAIALVELGARYKFRILPFAAVCAHLMWAGIYSFGLFQNIMPFRKLNSNQYIESQVGEYSAIEYINDNLPNNSKIYLLLTGNRFYYYNRSVYSPGHYSGKEVVAWLHQARSAEDIKKRFESLGITHLLGHAPRVRELLQVSLDAREAGLWNDFVNQYMHKLYSQNNYVLWELH